MATRRRRAALGDGSGAGAGARSLERRPQGFSGHSSQASKLQLPVLWSWGRELAMDAKAL